MTNSGKFKKVLEDYEEIHKDSGFVDEMLYYKTLAMMLKGNRALDIGCGEGFVEMFAPDVIGVDFSEEALKAAKKNNGKYLVRCTAEKLPFKDDAFEVSLNAGVLEHFMEQESAMKEIARVSERQINIVHAALPYILEYVKKVLFFILRMDLQPVEKPLTRREMKKMFKKNSLRIIFDGFWNYIDLRYIWKRIPYGIVKIPSHWFYITVKTEQMQREFIR